MSKYIKLEDIETLITACEWRMTLAKERHGEGFVDYSKQVLDVDELTKRFSNLPTIEVDEDNEVIYGAPYNCILTMFGECSYNETGCGSCAVAEKIRKALSVEVSEDCISRAELRKSLARPLENNNADEMYWKGWHDCTVAVETRIADAPSVVPSRAEGEWIPKQSPYDWYYPTCSVCGFKNKGELNNYCPNCGAKMKG